MHNDSFYNEIQSGLDRVQMNSSLRRECEAHLEAAVRLVQFVFPDRAAREPVSKAVPSTHYAAT